MTIKEFRAALAKLNDEQLKDFIRDFGGVHRDREEIVVEFMRHPETERHICYLLDLATEAEKTSQAVSDASASARWSAVAAVISSATALAAMILAVIGIIR